MSASNRVAKVEDTQGNWPCREAVGSLMWLANNTGLDIGDAVRAASHYNQDASAEDWHSVLRFRSFAPTSAAAGTPTEEVRPTA